jgi:hypothetical protein
LFSTTRFRELTTAVKKEDYVVVAVSAKNVSHLFDELSRKKLTFRKTFEEHRIGILSSEETRSQS